MQCHCREKTSFCGASALNIAPLINDMSGTLSVSCGAPAAENGTAKCAFKQTLLNNLFGPDGLGLNGCTFGECVAQSVVNASSSNSTNDTTDGGGKDLSGGVIAGLAVVGALVALALALLLLGCIAQRRARRVPKDTTPSNEGVAVEWSDVSYVVAAPKRILSRRSGREESADKVILDGVSGNVPAGQILAILGPSGELSSGCPIMILSKLIRLFVRCWKDNTHRYPRRQAQSWQRLGSCLIFHHWP
jgi:hypothetical protein